MQKGREKNLRSNGELFLRSSDSEPVYVIDHKHQSDSNLWFFKFKWCERNVAAYINDNKRITRKPRNTPHAVYFISYLFCYFKQNQKPQYCTDFQLVEIL